VGGDDRTRDGVVPLVSSAPKHVARSVPEVDLNTVAEVVSPAGPGQWRPGDAWLGGGTALFGEPRPHVRRLLDLAAAGWTPIVATADGIEVAATCTIAELAEFRGTPEFTAFHGIARGCCNAFLASFKVWNVATVGGNICAALPAGPMIALTAALDGSCLILRPGGQSRRVPVAAFVTGDGKHVLGDGELLRSVWLPRAALTGVSAYRQGSLHTLGRSAALLAGRRDPGGALILTVTAATRRPVQLRFPALPSAEVLQIALSESIPADIYVDDVHGLPAWRRHLTRVFAEEIRQELAA
jgi:CO/xanthine dehydrogenase FAD-binding subunit